MKPFDVPVTSNVVVSVKSLLTERMIPLAAKTQNILGLIIIQSIKCSLKNDEKCSFRNYFTPF